MVKDYKDTLDCQGCGIVLRTLTMREAQMIAHDPYKFVFYCHTCKQEVLEQVAKGIVV